MKKIIGIGNSLVDILVKLENDNYLEKFELPKGSMTLVDADKIHNILVDVKDSIVRNSAGGSVANMINGLAKLGVETGFVGKTGKSKYGDVFVDDLISNGVKANMFRSETLAGCVAALISKDSERTFATYLGASIELSAADLSPELFADYDICCVEGYLVQNHELIETACKYAKQKNCMVALDLASFNVVDENLDFLKRIVKDYIDILFANEEEAKSFTEAEPEEALNIISEMVKIAVVKIGEQGSMIKSEGKIYKAGIMKANAVDTTGAGDLFASGFLYGYVNNYSFDKCALIGAITGGHIVEVIGAKMEDNTWDEIKEKIKSV